MVGGARQCNEAGEGEWGGPVGPGGTVPGSAVKRLWIQFKLFQKNSNDFKNFSNFDRFKKHIPKLTNMVGMVFALRNNFLYRYFFRFEVDFEWKFREALGFEFD
jgi:hypothetical protein